MKKLLKRILIIIGAIFVILVALGIFAVATETPEQKAEREAKMQADKAKSEAEKAAKAKTEAEQKAKAEAEKLAKEQAEAETIAAEQTKAANEISHEQVGANTNLGMTPQQIGVGVDKLIKEILKTDINLKSVKTDSNIYMLDLGNGVTWFGDVDKTGNAVISTYNIKFNGKKETDETLAVAMLIGATARVLSPELPKEQTAGETVKLMNEAMTKFNETSKGSMVTKIVGNYKYIAEVIPESNSLKFTFVHKDH